MSSTVLLKPFLEEWDGPLPRGFLALAVAKGITLQQQPFSLAPHTLQAMRRDLRHTSLAKALQVRSIIHSLLCHHRHQYHHRQHRCVCQYYYDSYHQHRNHYYHYSNDNNNYYQCWYW